MQREKEIRNILLTVLFLNCLVASAKLICGYFIKSMSMIADGFHSFSDGVSNIIGLVGIRVASKPADKEHLYGHKKYESFYALVIGGLLLLVSFNLLKESLQRFYKISFSPLRSPVSFIIMLITMGINLFVGNYEFKKGKEMNSDILISDSLHTRSDFLVSSAVIVALISTQLGYPHVDPLVSIIISLFIAFSAFKIIRSSSQVLCDTAVIDAKEIEELVKSIDKVIDCHKIRTRGRKDDIHIDLHVLVRADMHMEEAHQISYKIEEEIKKFFPQVSDIVVHMESVDKKSSKRR
ncbi:MAG: cation diffusion facilitator family transporter [Candidatus Omnitrophica bacterium]|nr:cation diffusion facilitator family transporter [Candidatus Omnitrophota bacterium]MCM8799805.1 cation diffusion facilitator family transporter [Candidatus Omnitrophota bacterium]